MPLYEYRCTKCSHRFDKIQKFNDEPETVCPKCGGELQRPLTAPALQFKGSGWYVSDYAAKPAAGSAEKISAEAAPANQGKAGDTKSGETKSAATETKPTAPSESTPKTPSSSSSSSS